MNGRPEVEAAGCGDKRLAARLGRIDESAEGSGASSRPPERVSTFVRCLDAVEALKTRANVYRDILQVHVSDLERTLGELAISIENC
jgi:hypothetical protein